jgi:hypothetical protein
MVLQCPKLVRDCFNWWTCEKPDHMTLLSESKALIYIWYDSDISIGIRSFSEEVWNTVKKFCYRWVIFIIQFDTFDFSNAGLSFRWEKPSSQFSEVSEFCHNTIWMAWNKHTVRKEWNRIDKFERRIPGYHQLLQFVEKEDKFFKSLH